MNRKYWYWINNIEGIGNAKIRTLMEAFDDSPKKIYEATEEDLSYFPILTVKDVENITSGYRKEVLLAEYEQKMQAGEKMVFPCDEEYPDSLREVYDKPFVLYYRGKLPPPDRKNIAIVGSRKCSEYGRNVARELGRILSVSGANIISGLALGIDSEAHTGCVLAGGYTCAVLAGGTEKCYPAQNFNLYMDILNTGCILSEYPDGTPTRAGMFPLRNRIISGLCEAVIVVEAGKHSGSLITAAQALEQNRDVYAVPGRIGDPTGAGCNDLIAQGACVLTDYDTIIRDLGLGNRNVPSDEKNNLVLASDEKMLYSQLLDFGPKSLETILEGTGMPIGQALKGLIGLEIKGIIKEIGKNFYVRIQ